MSGLLLPQKAKEKPAKGIVIAIGNPIIHYDNGCIQEENCQVKKGETVIFYRWGTQTIKEENKEYLLVKFSDLQALYE